MTLLCKPNQALSHLLQKPHDLSNIVDTEDGSFLIMSQAAPSKSDEHLLFGAASSASSTSTTTLNDALGVGSILMDESVSMDDFKMSPATDALEFLLSAASHASLETATVTQNDEQVTDSTTTHLSPVSSLISL